METESSDEFANADLEFDRLIDLARAGDHRAIEQLVTKYEPEVRTVVRMRLGLALRPYLDTVDVMQSLHKSLMIGLQKGRFDIASPQKLVALATTIVRRKVARQWRKMRRQQRLSDVESGLSLPDLVASLSSGGDDPANQVENQNAIENLFATLSEQEQKVIELKLEGFSTAEVARNLGLDADVLRVRLSRLRKRLYDQGILADLL